MEFIRKNLGKLREEEEEHMPIGFEVAFPSLIQMAQTLGIHLFDHSGVLQDIYSKRKLKLSRIPPEMVHNKATTLLHSLEGMSGLNWEKLLKLQSKDGSFLFSPSSTAYALMQTKDLNCFSYLQNTLNNFNGGGTCRMCTLWTCSSTFGWSIDSNGLGSVDSSIPRSMPAWTMSTIISLISWMKKRYWSDKGICWARNSEVQDIDDTAMGFRLLRLHGYHVSADVFEKFRKEGEFMCFAGQSSQAVTGMFNLYRASQLQYPGETVLQEARSFSSNYLTQKKASNQLLDKWIIQKDLPGEVSYALDLPWYASLPRIEARFYIEQYGGEDDVWIGKTLYRMPYVSNNSYLELAKLDYNACQTVHQIEWNAVKRWWVGYSVNEFGLTQKELLRLYFIAGASIFEPERSNERLAWTKTTAMVTAIAGYFSRQSKATFKQRREFAEDFLRSYSSYDFSSFERRGQGLMGPLLCTLHQLYFDVLMANGVDIRPSLCKAWWKWMLTWAEDGDRYKGEAELVARTIQACTNNCCLEAVEQDRFSYNLLLERTNKICHKLGHLSNPNEGEVQEDKENGDRRKAVFSEVNSDMQRLLELVLSNYSGIDPKIRHSFLVVARAYYYSAYSSHKTISSHLAKVLFKRASKTDLPVRPETRSIYDPQQENLSFLPSYGPPPPSLPKFSPYNTLIAKSPAFIQTMHSTTLSSMVQRRNDRLLLHVS
ncbi:hypothetical protein V2J09_016290 [Rumex salicifolius]